MKTAIGMLVAAMALTVCEVPASASRQVQLPGHRTGTDSSLNQSQSTTNWKSKVPNLKSAWNRVVGGTNRWREMGLRFRKPSSEQIIPHVRQGLLTMKQSMERMAATSISTRALVKPVVRVAKNTASLPKEQLLAAIDSTMTTLNQHPQAMTIAKILSTLAVSIGISAILNHSFGLAEAAMGNVGAHHVQNVALTTGDHNAAAAAPGTHTNTTVDTQQVGSTDQQVANPDQHLNKPNLDPGRHSYSNMYHEEFMKDIGINVSSKEHLDHIYNALTPPDYTDPHKLVAKIDHGWLARLDPTQVTETHDPNLDGPLYSLHAAAAARAANLSQALYTIEPFVLTGDMPASQMGKDGEFAKALETIALELHKQLVSKKAWMDDPEAFIVGFVDEVRKLITPMNQ